MRVLIEHGLEVRLGITDRLQAELLVEHLDFSRADVVVDTPAKLWEAILLQIN